MFGKIGAVSKAEILNRMSEEQASQLIDIMEEFWTEDQ